MKDLTKLPYEIKFTRAPGPVIRAEIRWTLKRDTSHLSTDRPKLYHRAPDPS